MFMKLRRVCGNEPLACAPVTYEHGIILPVIIVDLIFLEGSGQDFPRGVLKTDFKAFEAVAGIWSWRLHGWCEGHRAAVWRVDAHIPAPESGGAGNGRTL